jgi:hypothetical protein
MAGVIGTGNLPKLNWPGLKLIHSMTYKKHPKVYSRICTNVDSDKAWEEYQGVTGFGLGQIKPQGQSMMYDSQQQGYNTRIQNQTYALGYVVTMEERQDNQYQEVANYRTAANAFSMEQAKEQTVSLMLNRAFTSGYIGGDGVVLGSTAHTTVTGLTYGNRPTTDAALSEASLEDAFISIRGLQDDKGLYADIVPKDLIIPRQLRFTAHRLLNAVKQPDVFNNNPNAMKDMGIIKGVVEDIYLTSAGAWFITTELGTGGNGLIFQQRMPPEFAQDNDFDTKNFKAGTIERYGQGWDNPRGIWCNNGP